MTHEKSTSFNLRKLISPEIIFGENARMQIDGYLESYGIRRLLLVTDKNIRKLDWFVDVYDLVCSSVEYVTIFDNVSPNPRDLEVKEGALVFDADRCEAILAIGGGSVIDCAKGIGIVDSNGGFIADFLGIGNVFNSMPPLFCIPTTSGSGADVSQFAIFSDRAALLKFAVVCKSIVPDVSFVDPIPLMSMSPMLLAETSVDALVHSIEAYVSTGSSSVTDLYALQAIRIISKNLCISLREPHNLESRTQLMEASMLAGLAFSNASLGVVHSLAHSLGGFSDLPHGLCNAILLPFVVDYNFNTSTDKYTKVIQALTGSLAKVSRQEAVQILYNFVQEVGMNLGLANYGVNGSDFLFMASNAVMDPCNATNPRRPTKSDLISIYREAL